MTVYFTASVAGKKQHIDNYKKIIELLKSKKYKVIKDHIIKSTTHAIHSEKKEDRLKFQAQLEKWLNKCDFVVAETTFPSISVGYEISLAQTFRKPILLLYSSGNPPSLLAQHKDEKLVCEKYSRDNLSHIIKNFIYFIKGAADSRFTFFITPEIARFLDKTAKKQKLPKSVYLRKLIERKMKQG